MESRLADDLDQKARRVRPNLFIIHWAEATENFDEQRRAQSNGYCIGCILGAYCWLTLRERFMPNLIDQAYFACRVEQESILAAQATDPCARTIHGRMAGEYRKLVASPALPPGKRLFMPRHKSLGD
jgi:hypothetical protein